jgi:hypothetical protein
MNHSCSYLYLESIFSYLDFLKDAMQSGAGFLSLERSTNSNLRMKQCLIITALSTFLITDKLHRLLYTK